SASAPAPNATARFSSCTICSASVSARCLNLHANTPISARLSRAPFANIARTFGAAASLPTPSPTTCPNRAPHAEKSTSTSNSPTSRPAMLQTASPSFPSGVGGPEIRFFLVLKTQGETHDPRNYPPAFRLQPLGQQPRA